MVSIGDIRRWDASALDELFDELKKDENHLVAVDDELASSGKPKEWHGEAADAAGQRHRKLGDQLRELVLEIATVRKVVDTTAGEVRDVTRMLSEADDLARRYQFRIKDNGELEDQGSDSKPTDPETEEHRQQVIRPELTDRAQRIVRRADDADAELAKVLRQADKNLMETGGATSLADAAKLGAQRGLAESLEPPRDGSPAENARWWQSLPAETQAALAAAPPSWMGNMDGIPAEVRHTANVNRIDDVRFDLQSQAARLRESIRQKEGLPIGAISESDSNAQLQEYERIQAKLDALDDIETVVDQGNRQLLVLDSSGERMKAAVAVGNVDTAQHVAVFTPGMDSKVEGGGLKNYDQYVDQLRDQAGAMSREARTGEVAAVTWMGYEAPQTNETLDVFGDSVINSNSAREGGENLADFYRGINETHDGNVHLTAMGHSYGSTTTGYAVQEQNTGVDDVVAMGSPGLATPDASTINAPTGHVYNLESDWDPVAEFGRFGDDPSDMPGVDSMSTSEAIVDGERLRASSGHDATGDVGYLSPGTTSQHNASAVVAGQHDRIVDDPRG